MTWMFLDANDYKEAICLTEPGDERPCWPTSEAGGFPCRRWQLQVQQSDLSTQGLFPAPRAGHPQEHISLPVSP